MSLADAALAEEFVVNETLVRFIVPPACLIAPPLGEFPAPKQVTTVPVKLFVPPPVQFDVKEQSVIVTVPDVLLYIAPPPSVTAGEEPSVLLFKKQEPVIEAIEVPPIAIAPPSLEVLVSKVQLVTVKLDAPTSPIAPPTPVALSLLKNIVFVTVKVDALTEIPPPTLPLNPEHLNNEFFTVTFAPPVIFKLAAVELPPKLLFNKTLSKTIPVKAPLILIT